MCNVHAISAQRELMSNVHDEMGYTTPSQFLLLCRPLVCTERHSLLLLALLLCSHRCRSAHDKYPSRGYCLCCQCNHTGTCNTPYVYAHAAQGRARETQYPLDVVGHPTGGYPEHGRLGEPELEHETKALRAEPAERRDGRSERGPMRAQGAIYRNGR